MKLGLMADIHSNLPALEAVLEESRGSVDRWLCAGDLVGYYLWPNEVVEKLREGEMESVKGNHDDKVVSMEGLWALNPMARRSLEINRELLEAENLDYLGRLPEKIDSSFSGRRTVVVHGSPMSPIREYVRRDDIDTAFLHECFDSLPDLLILGHTHIPFRKDLGDLTVINPGSVGQPRDGNPEASYATVELGTMEADIHRVGYDIGRVVDRVRDSKLPDSTGERLLAGR